MLTEPGPAVAFEDGVRVARRSTGHFVFEELVCPPVHAFPRWEPDVPYITVVLEGGLEKSFGRATQELRPRDALAIPVGATHGTRLRNTRTRILKINLHAAPGGDGASADSLISDLVRLDDARVGALAWRLAAEVHARDASAGLAAEGVALELLAAVGRVRARRRSPRPAWVEEARELVHASPAVPGVCDVAREVGVHPSHLARTFRAAYGVPIGGYARRRRLEHATSLLASTDTPIARVAAELGFVDQSHFTRAFRKHVGVTPARYRAARGS